MDITVHEVQQSGYLREIERASGGEWGGTQVDKAFIDMLGEITGKEFIEDYCRENTADYLELMRHFELKKRTYEKESKVTLSVPVSLSESFEDKFDMEISAKCNSTKYGKKITWLGDKMRMDPALFQSFFDKACSGMVNHIRELLSRERVRGVRIIIMVGGFSESPLLQERIKSAFPGHRIIVPPDPGLAVLKGAVIYGHDPLAIGERIAKYTYGIGTNQDFDADCHPANRKIVVDEQEYCKDVFDKYVESGENVKVDEVRQTQSYTPLSQRQMRVTLPIYITEDKNPEFTDDCKELGSVTVDISKLSSKSKKRVSAMLKFGGTELKVEGKCSDTGEITKGRFNFLGGQL